MILRSLGEPQHAFVLNFSVLYFLDAVNIFLYREEKSRSPGHAFIDAGKMSELWH